MATTSPNWRAGRVVLQGRYRILQKLGSGTMGTIYLAEDQTNERRVALKLLRTERVDAVGLERLQTEFRTIAALHHRQIATAYDFGYAEESRVPFYTREFVDGTPLAAGPPPSVAQSTPGEYLRPFLDLLDALFYLHSNEILHLDLHAGNLIVSTDAARGSVLIDFGLVQPLRGAGAHHHGRSPSSSGVLRLSSTLPPELLTDGAFGPATDLYSVGRLLRYRLTGDSDSETRLPEEIPGWGHRLTLELERIISKAMQSDPQLRFQSAREFRDALSTALGENERAPLHKEFGDVTVGRTAELDAIEACLRGATNGGSGLVWLHGVSGIGKSRLLTEARWRAQLRGLAVVDCRFVGHSVGEPALWRALRSSRRRRPAWLDALSAEHGGSSAERAQRAADAFFIDDGPPLALILDDLDLADYDSRLLADAFLEGCVRRGAENLPGRALAVIVSAQEAPGETSRWAGRRDQVQRLQPLSRREARELLQKWLHPLSAQTKTLSRIVAASEFNPTRLRHIAERLHQLFGDGGVVPPDLEIPRPLIEEINADLHPESASTPSVIPLRALAVIARPTTAEELAAATGRTRSQLQRILRRLTSQQVLAAQKEGRRTFYAWRSTSLRQEWANTVPAQAAKSIHRKVADYLGAQPARTPFDEENLARHHLSVGDRPSARDAVVTATARLREAGLFRHAMRLAEDAASKERQRAWRLRFIELASSLYAQAGDHEEGVTCLLPVYQGAHGLLSRSDAVRVRRRLGVHYHRSGAVAQALRVFEEVRAMADPRRDLESLIFVESELAELHTLRGEYDGAREACRRGLTALDEVPKQQTEFRGRMEVLLRASLGHLELRQFELEEAQNEFQRAAELAGTFSNTNIEALILNNLGIVQNQLNRFAAAQASYRGAEKLLQRSGERRGILQVACNLATVAAKRGQAEEARERVAQARQILLHYPGKRLEFYVRLAEGMVDYFLGDASPAIEAFHAALPLGRELGDVQFVAFAEIYAADAQLLCGRYGEAVPRLRQLLKSESADDRTVHRMAAVRLYCAESLMGSARTLQQLRRDVEQTTETGLAFLDAWDALYLAAAHIQDPHEDADAEQRPLSLAKTALETFQALGVPSGCRWAQWVLLQWSMRWGSDTQRRDFANAIEKTSDDGSQRFLGVGEPLALAEVFFELRDSAQSERWLQKAATSIVGLPYLELDWRIEFLHARLAERKGDRAAARGFLHRSLHTRELLTRSLPPRRRVGYLEHPRFRALTELADRLERQRLHVVGTEPDQQATGFCGIVGRSEPMRRVFQTIDQLRDQELPVCLTGETGTGKDLVAKAFHATSPRADGRFFALHCGSVPDELFESELFGFEAGAFSGAEASHTGILRHLERGTLVLDEITSLSAAAQAKLLRVVDSQSVRPVGSVVSTSIDVRFIAASSTDVAAAVEAGQFRRDLYHRLCAVTVPLPPLRLRRDDVPLLAQHFVAEHCRQLERKPPALTSAALNFLSGRAWPGNVRELEAQLLRVLLTSTASDRIDVVDLEAVFAVASVDGPFPRDLLVQRELGDLRDELERAYLVCLFEETGGDIRAMMQKLDIKRSSLYRWFARLDIDTNALRRRIRGKDSGT